MRMKIQPGERFYSEYFGKICTVTSYESDTDWSFKVGEDGPTMKAQSFPENLEWLCRRRPETLSIAELCRMAHSSAKAKGFWDKPREFGTMIALIHGELSEALEEHRCGRDHNIDEELADVAIRLADLCEFRGINLERAIAKKMNYNTTRPPLHGKRY